MTSVSGAAAAATRPNGRGAGTINKLDAMLAAYAAEYGLIPWSAGGATTSTPGEQPSRRRDAAPGRARRAVGSHPGDHDRPWAADHRLGRHRDLPPDRRESGAALTAWRYTLIGSALVPAQLAAVIGLTLTGTLR